MYISKDLKLSNDFGFNIYKIKDFKNINIVEELNLNFSTMDNETNETMLVEYFGKYYLFGASPNTNWLGVEVNLDDYNKAKNKYYFFDMFFR